MEKDIIYSELNTDFVVAYRKEPHIGQMPPHVHNAVEIYLNLSDLPHALVGDKIVSVPPNTLIIFPSYCIHQLFYKSDIVYERYLININTVWLDNILEHSKQQYKYLKNTTHPFIVHLNKNMIQRLTENLVQLISVDTSSYFQRLTCFFESMNLIDEITQSTPEHFFDITNQSVTHNTVNKIIAYINNHIGDNITVSELAKLCYLNSDYISKIFKRYTNTTINNYIALQKMAKAQRLLQQGYTITQVQQLTGYSSYAHFFRTFKKQVGITPGEYQKRNHV